MRKSWEHVQSWKSSNNKDCNIAMTEEGRKIFKRLGNFDVSSELRPFVRMLVVFSMKIIIKAKCKSQDWKWSMQVNIPLNWQLLNENTWHCILFMFCKTASLEVFCKAAVILPWLKWNTEEKKSESITSIFRIRLCGQYNSAPIYSVEHVFVF